LSYAATFKKTMSDLADGIHNNNKGLRGFQF